METDEITALRQELDAVLSDWNALVKASGARMSGTAIGHVTAMRKENERLREFLRTLMQHTTDEQDVIDHEEFEDEDDHTTVEQFAEAYDHVINDARRLAADLRVQ